MDTKGAFIEENATRLYKEWERADTNLTLADYIELEWGKRNDK